MRIAFLTTQFPHARMGGIGAYTLAMATALAAQSHDIHLFTLTLPQDIRANLPALAPNVTIHEVEPLAPSTFVIPPSSLLAALPAGTDAHYRLLLASLLTEAFLKTHHEKPFHILEAPDYEALLLPALLHFSQNPGKNRPALITHLHSGSALNRLGNSQPTTPSDQITDLLEAFAISHADARCAPSHAVVQETAKLLKTPTDATILPLPIPLPASTTPPNPTAPILFIGRLEKLKGANLLLQAALTFLPQNPHAKIHFIGPDTPTALDSTSMQKHLESQIPPNLAHQIKFLGELPPSQIPAHLADSSFLVVPSLLESFSLVAAQALAHARPVIVSSNIGTTELVVGNSHSSGGAQSNLEPAGLTFDRNNPASLAAALEQLHTNPTLLATLSKNARTRAEVLLTPNTVATNRTAFYQTSRAHLPQRQLIIDNFQLVIINSLQSILTPAGAFPPTPGQRLLTILQSLQQKAGTPAQILLYGAGRHTTRLLAEKHLWEIHGHRVLALIDDAPRYALPSPQPHTFLNLPVHSSQSLLLRAQNHEPLPPIVLSTDTFQNQFWQNTAPFRAFGIPVFRLYDNP